jgi:F0F1-type ATP synthase assembly protein I
MSIELEVRSDDGYSLLASREQVKTLLHRPSASNWTSDRSLVHSQDGCRVEITLGYPEAAASSDASVAWVGFRVPAGARLQSAELSLKMAMALAGELGWRVYDPQRDDYVHPSELEPGLSARQTVGRLSAETRAAGASQFCRRAMRRLRRQSVMGVFFPLVLGVGAAVVLGWLFRFSIETRPWSTVSITLFVGLGLIALDVASDVLGEIHQQAVRDRKPEEHRAATKSSPSGVAGED